MKVDLQPGKYVVAVSGGVDSVVLLHLLAQTPGVAITVAHFDHGIRDDSEQDRKLVQEHAAVLGLPFVYDRVELGKGASEATAREARYAFLRSVQKTSGAQALVTAHHKDDLLETVIINLLRGTGRLGLSSLSDKSDLRRPLLEFTKKDIATYASEQGLVWREDTTNSDTKLLRNYIRRVLIPKLDATSKEQLLAHARHLSVLNRAIDTDLTTYLHLQPSRQTLDRTMFCMLPHVVAREVIAAWLRSHDIRSFDSKMLERLVVAIKTYTPGKQVDIDVRHRLLVGSDVLALVTRDR